MNINAITGPRNEGMVEVLQKQADAQDIEGKLPRRALRLVLDWAELHQAELLADCSYARICDIRNPLPLWSKTMEWDVTDVKVVGEFALAVRFQDGTEGAVTV